MKHTDYKHHNTKHGWYGTRLYSRWVSMKKRGNNPNNPSYHRYGGRGIKYHKDFEEFTGFRDYLLTLGWSEDTNLQIDRIDNDGDYTYGNLRLASPSLNTRNQERRINKSGYTGVYYREATGKYKASIRVDGNEVYLGYYNTAKEASEVYESYRTKLLTQ